MKHGWRIDSHRSRTSVQYRMHRITYRNAPADEQGDHGARRSIDTHVTMDQRRFGRQLEQLADPATDLMLIGERVVMIDETEHLVVDPVIEEHVSIPAAEGGTGGPHVDDTPHPVCGDMLGVAARLCRVVRCVTGQPQVGSTETGGDVADDVPIAQLLRPVTQTAMTKRQVGPGAVVVRFHTATSSALSTDALRGVRQREPWVTDACDVVRNVVALTVLRMSNGNIYITGTITPGSSTLAAALSSAFRGVTFTAGKPTTLPADVRRDEADYRMITRLLQSDIGLHADVVIDDRDDDSGEVMHLVIGPNSMRAHRRRR